MADFLPGYEASLWFGIGAPKKTPAEIVGKLNREINAILSDLTMRAGLADVGTVPMRMTPADFGRFIDHETEKWRR
jgi:tripartite-type tricarboxylate transporter receptor subunit TctC